MEFKVGDRVRAYGGCLFLDDGLVDFIFGVSAKVTKVVTESSTTYPYLRLFNEVEGAFQVHPKQCRRVRRKHPIAKT